MPTRKAKRDLVGEALRMSRTSLSLNEVLKSVRKSGTAMTASECGNVLEELMKEGGAWVYPSRVRNQKPRYWHKRPVSAVADRIFEVVSGVGAPITLRRLERILHAWQRPFLPEAVGHLVNDRRLFLSPRKFSTYVQLHPPLPDECLLAKHLDQLREILACTALCRSGELTLEDLMAFLAGGEPRPVPPAKGGGPELSAALMRSWYEQEIPGLLGSTAVPIPMTWERYRKWCRENGIEPTTAQFHEALSRLSAREEIELIPHDRTEPIASHEREILMQGPRGEPLYYWRWRSRRP